MEKTQRDKSYDFIRAFAIVLIVVVQNCWMCLFHG